MPTECIRNTNVKELEQNRRKTKTKLRVVLTSQKKSFG